MGNCVLTRSKGSESLKFKIDTLYSGGYSNKGNFTIYEGDTTKYFLFLIDAKARDNQSQINRLVVFNTIGSFGIFSCYYENFTQLGGGTRTFTIAANKLSITSTANNACCIPGYVYGVYFE